MTKVLIPCGILSLRTLYALIGLFDAFYSTNTQLGTLDEENYIIVNISGGFGKNAPMDFAKNYLKSDHWHFIKNGVLYKKWLDTGIVDKLGFVEENDSDFTLKKV